MHKSSKPAASPSAHFLGSRPRNTASITCIDLSYDPNLIMAALFMDLLVALTCGCLILFKTMLFVCAWVLTELLPLPVYAWKTFTQYCLKSSCNYSNLHTLPFSILNFTLHLKENPLNYLLLQSVF